MSIAEKSQVLTPIAGNTAGVAWKSVGHITKGVRTAMLYIIVTGADVTINAEVKTENLVAAPWYTLSKADGSPDVLVLPAGSHAIPVDLSNIAFIRWLVPTGGTCDLEIAIAPDTRGSAPEKTALVSVEV